MSQFVNLIVLFFSEYDEDPALQKTDETSDDTHHFLAVNASIPRREYKVDLSSTYVPWG